MLVIFVAGDSTPETIAGLCMQHYSMTANREQLSMGLSPCPNDTFMLDALIHGKLKDSTPPFHIIMDDVEALNQMALQGIPDITKMSYATLFRCLDHYALLRSGSALGYGCGPLLIATREYRAEDIDHLRIAIPGHHTTARLLLGIACPRAVNLVPMLFSDIEQAVLSGSADAGLIIHENRFTYEAKGLKKIIDLGEYWERTTNMPIPLGCIAMHRRHGAYMHHRVEQLIAMSVEHAFRHPDDSRPYVQAHASEMDPHVQQQHISTYVNHFSADLGDEGIQAVNTFYLKAVETGLIKSSDRDLFL